MSRTIVITGGSRGIGKSIVEDLALNGDTIEFCYRSNDEKAMAMVRELGEKGAKVNATQVDVGNIKEVKQWIEELQQRSGDIDIVINSAGITRDSALVTMNDEAWGDVIRTNLDGVYNVCKCVSYGMMKRRSGVILNMSSVSGVRGNIGQSNYAASKSGIIGFSKSLAKELGPYGVRVNVIAPGLIETDMTSAIGAKLDGMLKAVSLRRIGVPKDISDTVNFLVSDSASYITGQTLGVDGGLVL